MISDDKIKAVILFKLHKRGNWEASHTAFDNLKKGFKDEDLESHGGRGVEKMAKELVRQRLIITKPTHYGLQVSLNPRESQTIMEFMRRFFPEV